MIRPADWVGRVFCADERMLTKYTVGFTGVTLVGALALGGSAQTRVDPPKNSYKPTDDVQLGREATAQTEQQFPILRDDGLTSYVSDVAAGSSAPFLPIFSIRNFSPR